MKTKKSRCFTIVLYPDCDKDIDTLTYIINSYDYAYILHDRDIFLKDVVDSEGNIIHKAGDNKKAHYHVLFYFANPRSLDKVKEELNVDYLEVSSFYHMCRYLTHIDNKNKTIYSIDAIKSNILSKVLACYDKEINIHSLDSKILLNYLRDNEYSITFTDLTKYALENDCITELKKNCYFYKSFCAF